MSIVPRNRDISLPKAYGGCNCPCHRTGARHVVPCCHPGSKPKLVLDPHLAMLNAMIARLQAELEVRTEMYVHNFERPAEFCRRGYSSAYDTGYERGYRGHALSSPYSQSHLQRAMVAGWRDGAAAATLKIAGLVTRTKNPRRPVNAGSTPRAVEKGRRKPPSE